MEAAFTVCTFWLVEALALIGRTEEARELFDRLLSLDNGLGLYSEDILPDTLEQSGNFPQTYSHVGLINAAFRLSRRWDWLQRSETITNSGGSDEVGLRARSFSQEQGLRS